MKARDFQARGGARDFERHAVRLAAGAGRGPHRLARPGLDAGYPAADAHSCRRASAIEMAAATATLTEPTLPTCGM